MPVLLDLRLIPDSSGVEFSGNGAPLEVPRRDQNIEAVRFESALEALRQLGRVVKVPY